MIRAPFNFIRLSNEVFFPEWAEQISHDVPFIDWFSGVISLNITAESPVFVRNGHTQEDAEKKYPINKNNPYHSFSRIHDKYFIPGTSIKGAVRNVLSIISNGKIRVDKNLKFAQREWYNKDLYNLKEQQNNFFCGWLKWDKDKEYHIENHGKPYRIAHTRLDEYFKSQGLDADLFKDKFSEKSQSLNKERIINGKKYDPKTAVYKYKLVENVNLDNLDFEIDDDYAKEYQRNRVKVAPDNHASSFKGSIVFTGQPNQWKIERPTSRKNAATAGKFYDFVFKNNEGEPQCFSITDEDFRKYESIYEGKCDWAYWKPKLYTSGIPVFFRLENENKKLKDWGLAFLYKLPYEHTPFETLPARHQSMKFDLADCIFGTADKNSSLKGRVSFGHAFCTTEHPQVNNKVRLVLNSPKASYYPIYIEQEGHDGKVTQYKTYNDGQITGWKRYPIRNKVWETNTGSDSLDTILYPLNTGSKFVSKVRFFNLNTFELGALLSALTFHGNEDKAYHQLGQGKPYGYGKVKIDIQIDCLEGKFANLLPKKNIDKVFMAYYEYKMQSKGHTLQLTELLKMASCHIEGNNYEYMKMSNNRNENEFETKKESKMFLRPFSDLFHDNTQYRLSLNKDNGYSSVVNLLDKQISESYNKQRKERADRISESQRLRQEEENNKTQEAESRIKEGDVFKQNRQYEEALDRYKKAMEIANTLELKCKLKVIIDDCENRLRQPKQNINNLITSGKVTSINAYLNPITKWLKENNRDLSDDEKQQILRRTLETYNQLKKKEDKRNWKKSLKDLNKLLGMDVSGLFKD